MPTPLLVRPGRFYGLPLGNATGGPFAIRALAATGREEDVQTHTHEDAHFVFVLSGQYVSSAYGAQERAASPILVFNPPGITHRDRFVKGSGTFITVSCSSAMFREATDLQPLAHVAMRLTHPEALRCAFHIAREMRSVRDDAVLESGAWELLSAAGRCSSADTRFPPQWALRAHEAIMESSSSARLRIGDVAAEIGIHPVHLARVFRKAWGCSPGELLRWRRTELAAELLCRTASTAADIAQEVGFVDQSHLTHAFRTRFGLTPGAYRRVFRGYKTEPTEPA